MQKYRFSAFVQGASDLPQRLRAQGYDTVLITGTVTNVCCESSARDAVELEYKVIMVSDLLSGHAHGLHEATLATFYRIFGDVRPSREIVGLLRTSASDLGLEPARNSSAAVPSTTNA